MPAEGFEPPTNGLQSSEREFQLLIDQPLAALVSPVPRPTKAQLRHTQVELGTFLGQPEKPQPQRRSIGHDMVNSSAHAFMRWSMSGTIRCCTVDMSLASPPKNTRAGSGRSAFSASTRCTRTLSASGK